MAVLALKVAVAAGVFFLLWLLKRKRRAATAIRAVRLRTNASDPRLSAVKRPLSPPRLAVALGLLWFFLAGLPRVVYEKGLGSPLSLGGENEEGHVLRVQPLSSSYGVRSCTYLEWGARTA